ncbi:DUF91 domain-containing protein [Candidatus Poribacteria bacterium]|jgi:predicted transport protein|nr:DUF91 domain-containing protein [Candidatus Poribacteria bacterium]
MADIRLFRVGETSVTELDGRYSKVERTLQTLIETHLEALLGVRFLASEYPTGDRHRGRIDTLGIDENDCPVIVEYKRSMNQNVINQGLFYLNWLVDHRGDFQLLAQERLGPEASQGIEWSSPRLLCIAGDFTNYDEEAVQQMGRNIELIRYRRYDPDLLLLELVNAASAPAQAERPTEADDDGIPRRRASSTFTDLLARASAELNDRFESLQAFVLALGDDVQAKTLKHYVAFKRLRNFACVEVHPQANALVVNVKLDPDDVDLQDGFTRDVREIGHYGTGDLEITIRSDVDLDRAQSLLVLSYEST